MRSREAVRAALLLVAAGSCLAVFWLAHHIVLLGFVAVLLVVATPAIICLQIIVEALWAERQLGKRSDVSMVPPDAVRPSRRDAEHAHAT